jgi:hypothetical protein
LMGILIKSSCLLSNKWKGRNNKMSNQVELEINGKKILLSEFPEKFIKNTIRGMVSTLKGVDESIETIRIIVKDKLDE